MENPDIARLIARAKSEQAQREAEETRRLLAEQEHEARLEELRVERLNALIASWLVAMAEADYPNAEPILLHTHERERRTRVNEWMTEIHLVGEKQYKTAGWLVAELGGSSSVDDTWGRRQLYLTADGRLVKKQARGSGVGPGENVSIRFDDLYHKIGDTADYWGYLEGQIPEKLKAIAGESEVSWSVNRNGPEV